MITGPGFIDFEKFCEQCGKDSGGLLDDLIACIDPEFDYSEMDPDGLIHKDLKRVLRKHFGRDWKELLKK